MDNRLRRLEAIRKPVGQQPPIWSLRANSFGEVFDRQTDEPAGRGIGEPGSQSGLLEYWHILSRRKGTIVLIALAGALVGLLITSTQRKTYRAQMSLEVQDIAQDFPNLKAQENPTYYAMNDMPTQIRLLESGDLLEKAIAKLKSEGPEIQKITNYSAVPWRRFLHLPEPPLLIPRGDLVDAAVETVRVHESGQTRVIDVTVDSLDPGVAAEFANVLGDQFINENIEARWKMSQRTIDWLGVQLDKTRIKLEESEANLQAYARNAGLLFTGADSSQSTNVSEDKLRQLQQSLSTASADRVAKQSRYEIARSSSPEGLPEVLNDPALHEYQTKLTDLRRQIADLTAVYTSDYPKVKRLQAQLRSLESAFQLERAAILDRIKNEYVESLRREELLAANYTDQVRTVTGERAKSIQYTVLKREVESNRQLYEAMLERVKESGIASALRASNIRVVDAAYPPGLPFKPAPKVNMAMGLFTGFFLGVAFVVIHERMDRSFRSPGETPLCLNVPELGVIPTENKGAIRGLREFKIASSNGRSIPGVVGNSAESSAATECPTELATLHRKSSMMAEAFRGVIPHVIFPKHVSNRNRVIVVTSASPGEGKTTVVCNLAIALADIGVKVLLIDADLRRPRLHTVFGLDNTVGMSTILQSDGDHEQMLRTSIKRPFSDNLDVLVSGPAISNPGKALFADHFPKLIATLKQKFDMVLIDASPVLQLPDAPVLGRMADSVILVVRAGRTTREAALAAYKRVADVQGCVLGTILNGWDARKFPLGYYPGSYTT